MMHLQRIAVTFHGLLFSTGLVSLGLLSSDLVRAEQSAPQTAQAAVEYGRDIAPLLARNCLACHNAKKPEGGLNLETHTSLMAGGDSGAAIEVEQAADSILISRVVDVDDPMPPKNNAVGAKALTPAEVDLLKLWITAGAPAPTASAPSSMNWQAIPKDLAPIYALDSSADGSYLAVGHGNTAQVIQLSNSVDQPTQALDGSPLIDPNLQLADGTRLEATHLDLVQSLAFSPDSQWLATGGYRSVKLWRRQTAAQSVLAGISPATQATALSPQGERIASIVAETGIELVDVNNGQAHRFLKAHQAQVTALVWLSEQLLLSVDLAGGLALTDATTYQSKQLPADGIPAQIQQLAAMGEHLYALDNSGAVFRLQTSTGMSVRQAAAQTEPTPVTASALSLPDRVAALATSPAPQACLIVAYENQKVQVMAVEESGGLGPMLRELSIDGPAQRIALNSTGQTLLAVSKAGQAKLWKLESGELLAALDRDYSGSNELRARQRDAARQTGLIEMLVSQVPELQKASEAEVEAQKKVQEAREKAATELATKASELAAAQAATTETEQLLAAAQQRVTDLTTELEAKRKSAEEAETKRKAAEMELAQRDQALATAADGVKRAAERIAALEQRTAAEREVLTQVEAQVKSTEATVPAPNVQAVRFSHSGDVVVVASADHQLRLYQTATGRPLATLTGASAATWALQVLPDHQLRGVTADGRVLSWNLMLPWKLEQTIGTAEQSPFSDRITALDFSPNGGLLAVGSGPPSRSGEVQLIDLATATVAQNLGEVHSDTVLCLRFSPDGRQLASGGADKLCRIWQVDNGQALRALEGHTHHVLGLAWQDNGQRLATAGADQTVKIWKVESAEQVRTVAGYAHEVSALEFVGNSANLLTVCADGTVRLVNSDDGKTVRSFSGASDALYALTVSSDDRDVTVGGQAGQTWTWSIEKGELRQSAKSEK
jgi:WD40 repeat protein